MTTTPGACSASAVACVNCIRGPAITVSATHSASSTAMGLGYSSNAAKLFQDNFLSAGHGNAVRGMTSGIDYAYRYTPNTNTGLASLNPRAPTASRLTPTGSPC